MFVYIETYVFPDLVLYYMLCLLSYFLYFDESTTLLYVAGLYSVIVSSADLHGDV